MKLLIKPYKLSQIVGDDAYDCENETEFVIKHTPNCDRLTKNKKHMQIVGPYLKQIVGNAYKYKYKRLYLVGTVITHNLTA